MGLEGGERLRRPNVNPVVEASRHIRVPPFSRYYRTLNETGTPSVPPRPFAPGSHHARVSSPTSCLVHRLRHAR